MALTPDAADAGADGDRLELTEAMAAASSVFDAGSKPTLSDDEDSFIDLVDASSDASSDIDEDNGE
jgi:hypothetical protein